MAKLNQKQTLLVIGGTTLVLCGAAVGGVQWAEGLIEEQNTQIEAKERDIQAGRAKIAKIPDVERRVIVLRENVKEYVKILPKEAELTRFTRKVHDFAAKSGISLDRFVPVRGSAKGGAFERMSYQFYFQASLWQYMTFMNFFENYERFVSIRDFNLTRGAESKEGQDVLHSVRMTVETYVYNPKSSSAQTKIVNYEKKKKLIRASILAHSNLLGGEPYNYTGRDDRRDIFIDPRRRQNEDDPSKSVTLAQQDQMVKKYSANLELLRKTWARSSSSEITMFEKAELRKTVGKGLKDIKPRIAEVTEARMISSPTYTSQWRRQVSEPFKKLWSVVFADQSDQPNRYLSREEFDKLINSLKQNLAAGELEAAISSHASFQRRVEVTKHDPRYPLRVIVESLIIRAKIAKEFSAIPLKITGVLVNEQGKSGLILNDTVFEEGEYIDQSLFVKEVRQEEIEFVYKGFTLVKTL